MILSRGQNKVLHHNPASCYQHHCPTLVWAIRVTGCRKCQCSGKGDLNTWPLLIRTWNGSEHNSARHWWLHKAHQHCSFATQLFCNHQIHLQQNQSGGRASVYFSMRLLSAGWNLDKLHSQLGWLHWNPAEDKSWAEKILLVFPTARQGRTTILSIWPKLVSSCIKDPYRFHPKVSSYGLWWGMCCFWETMLSLWCTFPTQGNQSSVPTENKKGLEVSEMETAFNSKSS